MKGAINHDEYTCIKRRRKERMSKKLRARKTKVEWEVILRRAQRIGDATAISLVEQVVGLQPLPDKCETPDLAAKLEFNLALEIFRQHGLFIYLDSDGQWKVRKLEL
jgi:hypothetical protein